MWVDGLPGMISNSTLKLDKQIFKALSGVLLAFCTLAPKNPNDSFLFKSLHLNFLKLELKLYHFSPPILPSKPLPCPISQIHYLLFISYYCYIHVCQGWYWITN